MSIERRVLILARQSLTRADSTSIPVQIERLRRHYEARGDRVVGVVASENVRGWQEQRDDLDEARAKAAAGDYDVLAVYSVDRLARNVRILETVVHDLAQHGITIDSPHDAWIADPLVRQVMGAISEKFSRDLSARMSATVTHLTAKGRHQGPPPFGFARGDDDRLTPNLDAPAAALAYHLREQGHGRRRIRDELASRFGVALDAATVSKLLRNPAYAGGVKGPGKAVVWDAHEPIVSRDQWDRVQRLRAERPRAPRARDPHWLEGLAFCGCGTPLYRCESRPGYLLLRCGRLLDGRGCDQPVRGIAVHRAEAFVIARFGRDLAAVSAANPIAVTREMVARQLATFPAWEQTRAALERKRDRLSGRRERILEQRADGLIDRETCKAKVSGIDADLATIAADLDRAPMPVDPAHVARVMVALRDLAGAVAGLDGEHLRAHLARVEARLVLAGEPTLRYGDPFAEIVATAIACQS